MIISSMRVTLYHLHCITSRFTTPLRTGVTGEVVIPPGGSRKRTTPQHSTAEHRRILPPQSQSHSKSHSHSHSQSQVTPRHRLPGSGIGGGTGVSLARQQQHFFPSHDHFSPPDLPLPLTPSRVSALAGLELKLRLKPPESGVVP